MCTAYRQVRSAFSAIVFGAIFSVLAGATTWHVDGASGDDNNAGLLWSTAFATVQKALTNIALAGGDQIWVATGTYFPDEGPGQTAGDRGATFSLVNGVLIYGGFKNGDAFEDRDPDANETILSGDIDNTGLLDSYHVVSGGSTITSSTLLDGFTIELGRADGTAPVDQGGAIHLIEADPEIRRCVIRDCYAREAGGGIYVFKGNPTFVRCVFDSNVAMFRGGGLHFEGESGALTHAVVTNCVFTGNSTTTTIEFQARGAGGLPPGFIPGQMLVQTRL